MCTVGLLLEAVHVCCMILYTTHTCGWCKKPWYTWMLSFVLITDVWLV